MCSGTWNTRKQWPSPVVFIRKQQQQQKKKKSWPHVSVTLRRNRLKLIRRRRELRSAAGAEMAMLNLKLRLENRRIVAENERLRERASTLRCENLLLRANLCKTVAEAAPQEEVAPGC
uniref:Uncharacterized protein n=1 Tax=Avena sativa TaxID=4498 RepID=A0ACD5XU38_AVESA